MLNDTQHFCQSVSEKDPNHESKHDNGLVQADKEQQKVGWI